MKGFIVDFEDRTEKNSDFRHVLYTGKQMQPVLMVLMVLRPGEDIGDDVHSDRDQFFRVEKGQGEVWIDGKRTHIKSDMAVVVPCGARQPEGARGFRSTLFAWPALRRSRP